MMLPISVKGVLFKDGRVILLKNERDEWELPGGRLEKDELPEDCVVREIEEELGLKAKVRRILNTWVYPVTPEKSVFIVTYQCDITRDSPLRISSEHKELGLFAPEEISALNMPQGYKHSIELVM